MFKPLLKTIPSLSGNMKIVCNLEGYNIDSSNSFIYNCNVNSAYLTSISSNLYDKNIVLNLKNNSFEYDVKKFYMYYTDVFYKTNFNYSKINIPVINFSNNINNSNLDFKYGCKRVSYLKSGNQLAFFAPIYIENVDDIKGKYFVIRCVFNKGIKLTKFIKVKISNINEGNNLADYLYRYASKIDDKVIYCSNSYKNIYYGIDLKNGGFIKVEDNISSNLYNKYYTINDFDATINNGFKRNYMMMKQIIPLSFYFDPNNLLYDFEKEIYNNAEIIISGKWYDENDNELKFYDFSDDYSKYEEDIYNLYYDNIFKYVSTGCNIMDVKYPGCNEASSENYKFVNTVAKNYNRWKLKYSNDLYPYIINNNFAFSYNQNSLYTYKEFPIMYSPMRAYAKLVSNTEYNMLFDHNDIYGKDGITIINNKKQYFNLYNKNFISNFFDIFIKKDKSNNYIDIFSDLYKDYWTNVDNDGKVYHKGILYDLNTIYNNNLDMNYNIDKFGVFVKPEFNYTLAKDFNDIYKEVKTTFTYNLTDINNYYDLSQIYNYHHLNTKSNYILNYNVVKKDNNGDYVDINAIPSIKQQYEQNKYLDVNDLNIINTINGNKSQDLTKPLVFDKVFTKDNKEITVSVIDGYRLIEIYHVKNIFDDHFSELINYFKTSDKKNPDGVIFRSKKYIELESIYPCIDKLYFSIYPNKTKYSLLDNYSLLKSVKDDNLITVYYKTQFLKDDDDSEYYLSKFNITSDDIKYLYRYFYTNGLYDRKNKITYTSTIFRQKNDITNNYGNIYTSDPNIIYVDPYNLNKVYQFYLNKEYDYDESNLKSFYCKFLNIDHIRLYYDKLYKSNDLSGQFDIDNIYIKVRNFNNILVSVDDSKQSNFSTITLQDDYIPISNFGFKSISDILKYIYFDESLNCFYFNDSYIHEFIDKYKIYINYDSVYSVDFCQKVGIDINYDTYKYWKTIFINFDKYNITKFEICFKKDMLPLPEELYNLIINRENDAIFKDLYLYHIDDPIDFKLPMNYVDTKEYSINKLNEPSVNREFCHDGADNNGEADFSVFIKNYPLTVNYYFGDQNHIDNPDFSMYYVNSITTTLAPYFNDIYDERRTDTCIYSDYFINNIIKTSNITYTFYRYNEPSINFLVYIPKDANLSDNITQSELEDYRYSLVNDIKDKFITKDEFKDYNVVENPNNINQYSNLITYSYNGINYGFYMISSSFDNTNNTIKIQNEDLDYINCVDYINNIHVTDISTYSYSYLSGMYKFIMPYCSNTNPLKFLMNNTDTLIKPQIYRLKDNIKQYPNIDIDSNTTYSYTLYNSKTSNNIELSRYFDNIVPYIPEVRSVTSYSLYYKDTNKLIENDLGIRRAPYIMYQNQIDINEFNKIKYFDIDTNIHEFIPTEYKYYNHNKFYNLEKEIVININRTFTEQELIEYENDEDQIFKLFVNYINNNDFDTLSNKDKYNNYLFLYKKYEVKFIKDFKFINQQNQKTYSLTIKFSLL